jgi:P4 family phage/plasmid primase-like protien
MCRYEPPDTAQGENLGGPLFQLGSDTEIAQVACDKLENPDGPPLVFDRSELWQYKEELGIWEVFPAELVRNVIDTFDGERISAGVDRNGDPKTVPLKVGHRLCVNVSNRICDRRYHKGFFDTAKDGLSFANCFVYVSNNGVETEDFSPSQRATARLDFPFTHDLKPTKFVDTLHSCFQDDPDWQDKVRLLQQFVGVCLLGCATKLQKGMILVGAGANGKSTVQQIVSALFSHKKSTRIISAIPPQDMDQEYRRAMLASSRLNVVNELPEADILASESVKAMISGDLMTGRHIRQAPFEFVPKAGHLFSANNLPGVRDMSLGFWRRWLVVPFERTFHKHEQIPGLAKTIVVSPF